MRYYRYDLDQIAVVLDLTARALSLSLHSLRSLSFPPAHFLILSYPLSSVLSSLAGRLKISTGLKVPARPNARSNESMKNNTCPDPAAKIVNASRIHSVYMYII